MKALSEVIVLYHIWLNGLVEQKALDEAWRGRLINVCYVVNLVVVVKSDWTLNQTLRGVTSPVLSYLKATSCVRCS